MLNRMKVLAIVLSLSLVVSSGAIGKLMEKEREFIKLLDKAQIEYLEGNFSLVKELLNKACSFMEENSKGPQVETKTEERWVEITSWKGKGGKKTTEPFTIESKMWRIKYESQEDMFTVFVVRPGEKLSVATPVLGASAGKDISYVYESGVFYLDITAAGEWGIKIEQKL